MAYVSFNKSKTSAQIEALEDATPGKLYFGTDGGVFLGEPSGVATKKAELNKCYTHEQQVAASEWVVEHNLDMYPNVICIEENNGDRIVGEIVYDSPNALTITFSEPVTGIAYLS